MNQSHRIRNKPEPPGFALVVTLSLMILLTVVAIGLLGLSAVTLRTSSQGNATAEARAVLRLLPQSKSGFPRSVIPFS